MGTSENQATIIPRVCGSHPRWTKVAVAVTLGVALFAPARAAYADDLPPAVDPPVVTPTAPDVSAVADAVTAVVAQASPANINVSVRIASPGTDGAVTQANAAGSGSTSAVSAQPTSPVDAAVAAATQQAAPAAINVSVRVNSPGDNGAVTQANTAAAGASTVVSAAPVAAAATLPAGATTDTVTQYQPDPTQYQGANTPAISTPTISTTPSTGPVTSAPQTDASSSPTLPTIWTWTWNWTCSAGAPGGTQEFTPSLPATGSGNWIWSWSLQVPCGASGVPPPVAGSPPLVQPPPIVVQPPTIINPVTIPSIVPPTINPVTVPSIVPPMIQPPLELPAIELPTIELPTLPTPFVALPPVVVVPLVHVAPIEIPSIEIPSIAIPAVAISPEYQPAGRQYPGARSSASAAISIVLRPEAPHATSGVLPAALLAAPTSFVEAAATIEHAEPAGGGAAGSTRDSSSDRRDRPPPPPLPTPPSTGGLSGFTGLGGAVLLLLVALTGALQAFRPLWRSTPIGLNRNEPPREPRATDRDKPG